MSEKSDRAERSILRTVLRHPVRVLASVSLSNVRMFVSMAHYSGLRAAVMTTRHVLSNSMDDYDRSENVRTYTEGIGDVPEHMEFPHFDDPLVSVVVPVYNQYRFTLSCLHSVIKNTRDVPYEVILADDGSDDGTVDIGGRVGNLIVSRTEGNTGFICNCNRAASLARGKYILFLNNDTVVGEDWLRPLTDLAGSDPRIGAVGSKLVYPDGKLQEAGGIIWSDGTAYSDGKGENPNDPEYNYVKEVDYVSGASLMVRRDLFERLGGFDERYVPAYCEDSDFCLSVRALGYSVLYQPLSAVVHYEGMTHGKKKGETVNAYQQANVVKLREKWGQVLSEEHSLPGLDVFHARDRSFSKRTVLFITDHIPSRDIDSGSSMMFGYLVVLSRMGYNVKLMTADFHYDAQYTVPLEQAGVEVLYGIRYRDGWKGFLRRNRRNLDHIVISGYSVADRFMVYAERHTKARIHYYLRNDLVLGLERENGISPDAHTLLELATVKRRNIRYLGLADSVITVSSSDLRSVGSGRRIGTISVVPFAFFEGPAPPRAVTGRDILFVGNMLFRPNVDAVRWFVSDVMPLVRQRVAGARLIVVGGTAPGTLGELVSEDVVLRGHLDNGEVGSLFASCVLAVNPMRTSAGTVGTVLEAMYRGVPVVSTSTGLEGLEGLEYPSFDSPEQICEGIWHIFTDSDYSGTLSDLGRTYISSNYTKERTESAFRKIFRRAFL